MSDKPTLGLYAGSFNPFHVGHLDIVKQAADIFDVIMIAQGINSSKIVNGKLPDRPALPIQFLTTFKHEAEIRVDTYDTLLVKYIKDLELEYNVTLVRGLRNGADLEYEQNLVAFLRGMHPRIKVAAFYCDPIYRHISSGALRDIKHFDETEYKKYVITD
jgi:pantetheine-phosphate adenylyltransferase